jgi:hypothetical protein
VIEAKAHFDAPERVVHIRVGGLDDRLYLDLGDKAWRPVEISAAGWRVIANPPVRFRRAAGMQPLPVPARRIGETFRSFLNIRSDTDWWRPVEISAAGWRVIANPPVRFRRAAGVGAVGRAGFGEVHIFRDPAGVARPEHAPLRAPPREDCDLWRLTAICSLSTTCPGCQRWISDTLCRLATGGGFAVRQLYTDQEEVLFDAARPVILNGIEDIVARPDLADRAVFLTLEPNT